MTGSRPIVLLRERKRRGGALSHWSARRPAYGLRVKDAISPLKLGRDALSSRRREALIRFRRTDGGCVPDDSAALPSSTALGRGSATYAMKPLSGRSRCALGTYRLPSAYRAALRGGRACGASACGRLNGGASALEIEAFRAGGSEDPPRGMSPRTWTQRAAGSRPMARLGGGGGGGFVDAYLVPWDHPATLHEGRPGRQQSAARVVRHAEREAGALRPNSPIMQARAEIRVQCPTKGGRGGGYERVLSRDLRRRLLKRTSFCSHFG